MGYPVTYRGGRSPQRGLPAAAPDFPPPGLGPAFTLGVMAWAFGQLAVQLQGVNFGQGQTFQQFPGSYGWTLALDCGHPAARLPAAAFGSCVAPPGQPLSHSAWASNAQGAQNPRTASALHYYSPVATANPPTGVRVPPAQRWTKGAGRAFTQTSTPGVLLGGPIRLPFPVRVAAGMTTVGYDAPALPLPGRSPGFDQLDERWTIYYPGIPGAVPRPIPDVKPLPRPVARTVPVTGMREVKFNANTRAGRAFFAMYSTFNLLGDGLGFTRALWFSLPSESRGSSMRFRNMARDIWDHHREIDPLLLAKNVAVWKFLDTLYGGTQGAMFQAISAGFGAPLARVWATLESEVHATTDYQRRRLEREQGSQRGGGG